MNITDFMVDGVYDVDQAIDMIDVPRVEGAAPEQEKPPVPKERQYEPEPEGDIDPAITTGDMMALIYAEIDRKGIAGHHIDSMNSFNKVGIKQIVTKIFVVEGRIRNQRDKTEEDRDITDITFRVDFTDINLSPPTTTKYKSGRVQMLMPNMARLKNLTYSCPMSISATVTATATYKNGTTKTRTAELKDHRIASIPCMVGTELCNTFSCSRETRKEIEEDPTDSGGYFIVKGGEWAVDNLENITNNMFHVYKNMHMNEIVRGNFLSKPGDAFENSYQVILRYLNNGAITVEITTSKFDKFEIPYYLLFRALGMTKEKEIINHIVYGIDNDDPITKHMMEVLTRSFEVDDAKFGPILRETNPTRIIEFIAAKITEMANPAAARKDENITKYLNNNVLGIIDRYIFPHIGTGIEHRIKKLRFLGHLIHKLIRVELEVLDSTDRDSYKNKRVHAAGTSIAKTFKTDFNYTIAVEIKKHLTKDFKSTPFSQVQLVESIKAAINSDDLERMLVQAITSGNKTITVRRNEVTNRVSSQTVYHKNDLNVKSIVNTINTPNMGSSKQNERADEMRRVHPTYLGYIDLSQSADTGEKVGMSKQMACTASVCGASSSYVIKRILEEDPDVMKLDDVAPEQISADKLAKIFVNGDWIGCCRESHNLVYKYRTKRRHGDIHHFTTIVWEPLIREVYFWTDVGRLMRPLVIVYNNLAEYIADARAAHAEGRERSVQFKQWIKLTKKHIKLLREKKITMDDLRRERIIEYISPEEQENAYIAPNINELRAKAHDVLHAFTHCDIDQAIFGIVTMASPLANHSLTVRNTMYTNHRKQSAGWFALNFPYRIDKNTTLQYYCERPLVSSFTDGLTMPNGQNCIVALALHSGFNCEDSIICNKSSVDCGMFNGAHYNYEKAELEKGEQFGNPDFARTMDIKKDAIYEHVENGFIKEGTFARKGHVLIVKTAKMPKPIDQFTHVDRSIVYKHDEPVFIERVIMPRNDEDQLIAKVKLRADRPVGMGDKLACLTDDHEVLTKRGWVSIAEVTLEDEVACLIDNANLSYAKPTALHRYSHDGQMYHIKNQQIDLFTTMNHRMYVKRRGREAFELIEAQKIAGKRVQYKKDAAWTAPDVEWFIAPGDDGEPGISMDDWLDLLGIFLSDGYLMEPYSVVLCGKKQRKIDHINDVAARLGLEPKLDARRKQTILRSKRIYEALKPLNVSAINKYIPDYVFGVSQRQARILYTSLISCDGHIKAHGSEIYCTSSKRLADDFMRLALHCGWSALPAVEHPAGTPYRIVDPDTGRVSQGVTNADYWRIGVNKAKNTPMVNHSEVRKQHIQVEEIVNWRGMVYCLSVPSEVFLVRRFGKQAWTGNSRSGNKGILAKMVTRADMPYTEDGLVPDLIVNAHSIPTRMAVNQIIECMLAQLAVRQGAIIDATPFREIDINGAIDRLKEYGIQYGGLRRMYNGRTGDWIDTLIFIGPTTYQRLQKFVIDEHYAIRTGPTSALTRLPLEGKNNDGGLRIGEMEKDVYCSSSCMRALTEKMYNDADGTEIPICRICGNVAVVNERQGMYKCKYCGDNADIANVFSSWVANLFWNEASAMNCKLTFELEKYGFNRKPAPEK